jgi:purine-nucleoside phosphorylase
MSTVPETIVARHSGMRVLGISTITNMAAGVLDQPINHEEVLAAGELVKEPFRRLVNAIIDRLPEEEITEM